MCIKTLLSFILLGCLAMAESRTEADLRARLDASESARTKDKAALSSALSRLAAHGSARATVAAGTHSELNATLLKMNEDGAARAVLIQESSQKAETAATDAGIKTSQAVADASQPKWLTLGLAICAAVGAIAAAYRSHQTASDLKVLKVEMNGNLSKLLALTGQEAFARGQLDSKNRPSLPIEVNVAVAKDAPAPI